MVSILFLTLLNLYPTLTSCNNVSQSVFGVRTPLAAFIIPIQRTALIYSQRAKLVDPTSP